MSINTKYIYLYIYGNTCLEIIRRSYAGVTYHCWELQLPFHLNGSYRFRTVVTVPERHMPWHYRFRTVVTVSERQLPFQNGSYRSRTAYAMVCQWSRRQLPFQNGSYRFRTAVTVPERHMPWYVSGRGGTCHRPLNDLGVSQILGHCNYEGCS